MKRLFLILAVCIFFVDAFADTDSSVRFRNGVEMFNKGKYEVALTAFMNARKSCPVDSFVIVDSWIARCNFQLKSKTTPKPVKKPDTPNSTVTEKEQPEVQVETVLEVEPRSHSFKSEKSTLDMFVMTDAMWKFANSQSWCQLRRVDNDHLVISCEDNNTLSQRVDTIVITANEKQLFIPVVQDPGNGVVFFKTNPDNANILFVDDIFDTMVHSSTERFSLPSGSYKVRISKGGYQSVDTTVVVANEGKIEPNIVNVNMKPLFGKVLFKITAPRGSNFQTWPTMRIGNKDIDLAPMFNNTTLRSFNSEGAVEYYSVYEDNVIPLQEGLYEVRIQAKGFKEYTRSIPVTKGEQIEVSVVMQPISGFITLSGNDLSIGAKILMDDFEIGTVPVNLLSVPEGRHVLRFEKEKLMTVGDSMIINVEANTELKLNVEMRPFLQSKVVSTPVGAEVYVDNVLVGHTPAVVNLTDGEHDIEVRMHNYFSYKERVKIRHDREKNFDVTLHKIHPLHVSCDDDNIAMSLRQGNKYVATDVILPNEVSVPYGRYTLELWRPNGKRAYKTTINHTEKSGKFNLMTFPTAHHHILGLTYGLSTSAMNDFDNIYSPMATAILGQLQIAPGLSTNVIRASLYSINADHKDKKIAKEGQYNAMTYYDYLLGLSCLFINADFRIGGAVIRNIDVSLLASYAWMPPLTEILPFSHISGHDVFVGAEFSSRIPYFNLSVRAGWQMVSGFNHISRKSANSIEKPADSYVSDPLNISNFVISVSATLGGKNSKGNNILRLF